GPLPALDDDSRRFGGEKTRVATDLAELGRAAAEAGQERAVIGAGVEDFDVLRIGRDVARLAAADGVERFGVAAGIAAAAAAAPGHAVVARNAQRAVVLLRAADVKRHVPGRDHVVELLGRKALPRPAALRRRDVVGHRAAAVVAEDDVL